MRGACRLIGIAARLKIDHTPGGSLPGVTLVTESLLRAKPTVLSRSKKFVFELVRDFPNSIKVCSAEPICVDDIEHHAAD